MKLGLVVLAENTAHQYLSLAQIRREPIQIATLHFMVTRICA